ncbi:class I SAM-dependent methyltransferase [Winogradskya consettensis]|uniref:Methyltransferase n=1 Tax=Winogradskya consettensis TaxID=113560 RepID=A0A919SZR2_9ACTN|nr:class I SAM-dependent methyltransferase [Actinoplanes consettensis]GIM80689.1 methyltransferase [Actinoplanes consettensis]
MPPFDELLYAGSAVHYPSGRMPYPSALADALRGELGLDGSGRLLDVGCGPGPLTTLLAPLFAEATGIDADADMIGVARAAAPAISWRRLHAEELPADLGTFRVVTFAQSFHWMDRELVARRVRPMIEPGGAWVHVSAATHRGLPGSAVPWDRMDALVAAYLGPVRRAGRGLLPDGTPGGEEEIMRAAGYRGPARLPITGGDVFNRTADDIVSSVFSLSSSAPHLFAERLGDFEAELRGILRQASPSGLFAERRGAVEAVVWRP